ncbi:hypothetical protein GOV14_02515 [Candidatus Pacearchaeota archaeon]|nr:hypothetical protein [Candidatus Pacearchaeota archaeon]
MQKKGYIQPIKALGTLLTVTGLCLIILRILPTITGAVINISAIATNVWFFIGIACLISGTFLLIQESLDRKIYVATTPVMIELGKKTKQGIIFDTNALIDMYKKRGLKDVLDSYFKNHANAYIPEEVQEELETNSSNLKNVVKPSRDRFVAANPVNKSIIDQLIKRIKPYTHLTPKAQDYYEINPFLIDAIDIIDGIKNTKEKEQALKKLNAEYTTKVPRFEQRLRNLQKKHKCLNQMPRDSYTELHGILRDSYNPDKRTHRGPQSDADSSIIAHALYHIMHRTEDQRKALTKKWNENNKPVTQADKNEQKMKWSRTRRAAIISRDNDIPAILELMRKGYKGVDPKTKKEINLKSKYPMITRAITCIKPSKFH